MEERVGLMNKVDWVVRVALFLLLGILLGGVISVLALIILMVG